MSTRTRQVLFVGFFLVAAALAVTLALPWYVKKRIVEDAQARGVTVQIDQLSLGWGKARADKVTATFPAVPQIRVEAAQLLVTLDGLSPREVDLTGMTVDVTGPIAEVSKAVEAFQGGPKAAGGAGGAGIVRVGVTGATVHWLGLIGADTSLTVEGLGGTMRGADVDLDGAKAQLTVRAVTFGPYRFSFKRAAGVDTITFKAPKEDVRYELVLGPNGKRTTKLTIPRSGAKDLGVPTEALGLVADEKSSLELHLEHTVEAGKVDGHLALAADRVYLGHSLSPTSVQLDFGYGGAAEGPDAVWTLHDGTLKAGPFSGNVRGTLKPVPGAGLLAHFEYLSGLMSCGDAVKSAADSALAPALGPQAAAATSALAQLFGMDKAVAGTVKLEGTLDADTRNLSMAKATFHTTGDCTLSFLPGK
jgi:hypothetical protein